MGKVILVQRRGKGSTAYRAPSFNFKGKAAHPDQQQGDMIGTIREITTCIAHSAPIAIIDYTNGQESIMLAPEGVRVGQQVKVSSASAGTDFSVGNTLRISDIPEGTLICNIEATPGDGGKFARASGTYARLETKTPSGVIVRMPSRKSKTFNPMCRATIGVLAGGGRTEKPILKAGIMWFKRRGRNQRFPIVAGSAMNAVNHPYGNKRTSRHAKKRPVSRHAPPGRKVGMIAARRTGRKNK